MQIVTMEKKYLMYFFGRLKKSIKSFSFIFTWRFFCLLFFLSSVYFWLASQGIKSDKENEIADLKRNVSYYQNALLSLQKQQSERKNEFSNEPEASSALCMSIDTAIKTRDGKFAACIHNDVYQIFRKDSDPDGFILLYEETGRISRENELYISYSGNSENGGSKIFKLETEKKILELLVDPLYIPNKELFIDDQKYSPQFHVWSYNQESQWSPEGRFLLILVHNCWGCTSTSWLYAYDFGNDRLIYIGEPYMNSSDSDGVTLLTEWVDSNTLRWEEGIWRDRTEAELEQYYKKECKSDETSVSASRFSSYCPPPFPVVQESLGYRTTAL